MFKVYLDNKLLWTPEIGNRKLLNPTVKLEVNKAGSFSFKILPDHPHYDSIVKMRSIVTVKQDHRTIFKGRVFSSGKDFRLTKTIKAEGCLAYFNDSIVAPYEFSGTPAEYLEMLIAQHNDQVSDHQKFILGTVTVTDPNDYISRASSDRPNTWKEINSKLIEKLGGYIHIRYESDGNYIDYLSDYTDTSAQKIALAVNLIDLDQIGTADDLKTCIIPFGAKDDNGNRIDITSVNNGLNYVSDPNAVALYGKIFEVVTWDDVTVPANLLRKATEYLGTKVLIPDKITIKVIDLHLADDSIEGFKLGDYVEVFSSAHDVNTRALISSYSMDLSDPANAIITIGITRNTYLEDVSRDNTNRSEEIRIQIGESSKELSNQVLKQSEKYIKEQIENAEESTRLMIQERVTTSELEEYKQTVSGQFSQTAESLSASITQVNERITDENGEMTRQITEISKWAKYTVDGLELGAGDSAIKLILDNDIIKFTKNGQVFGYWDGENFHTGNLLVDVNEKAQFGDFAFIPRSDGSLMFLKVSGDMSPDPDPLEIVSQSSDISGKSGNVVELSVTATGDNVQYQWQNNISGSWSNISGQTSSTISLTLTSSMNGKKYRCIVSDNSGESIESEPITITVTSAFSYSVNAISGAEYGFSLNSDGYYESTNKGVKSSCAICRVNFQCSVDTAIYICCINSGEEGCDYGIVGKLDTALSIYNTSDSTYLWKATSSNASAIIDVNLTVPAGSHFVDIKYKKDSSVDEDNDSLQFRIEVV